MWTVTRLARNLARDVLGDVPGRRVQRKSHARFDQMSTPERIIGLGRRRGPPEGALVERGAVADVMQVPCRYAGIERSTPPWLRVCALAQAREASHAVTMTARWSICSRSRSGRVALVPRLAQMLATVCRFFTEAAWLMQSKQT